MKDCYYDLGLHFILLDDCSQSYILKLRDRFDTRITHAKLGEALEHHVDLNNAALSVWN